VGQDQAAPGPQGPEAGQTYQGYPPLPPFPGGQTQYEQYAAGGAPPPPPYGAPQPGPYGYGPYGYPYPPPRQPTNTLAILALVFAFVCAPAAIVLGVIARRQIRRTGEQGQGMATAGLVMGIVFTVLSVIWIVVVLTLFAHAVHDINQQNDTGGQALAAAFAGARAHLGR
jgi:uncharacterized membrane protein